MKWITTLLILLAFFFLVFVSIQTFVTQSKSPLLSSLTPTPKLNSTDSPSRPIIKFGDQTYEYLLARPQSQETISLYSNLPEKKVTHELKSSNQCRVLTSGGFYTKEDTHLGLLQTEFEVISKPITSALLNGFIWQNEDQSIGITTELPENNLKFALQTGPLLFDSAQKLPLKIKEDEPARRVVAIQSPENTLILLIITQSNQVFAGPLLAELPSIVELIAEEEKIDIINAINLDGGNHSAFLTETDQIGELSPVGSFFCIK